MKLKKLIPILVCLFLLTTVKLKAQTVYITESGKKYHAKNCSLVKTGKKGIDLAEAKKQGYEPCQNCKTVAAEPNKAVKGSLKSETTVEEKKKS